MKGMAVMNSPKTSRLVQGATSKELLHRCTSIAAIEIAPKLHHCTNPENIDQNEVQVALQPLRPTDKSIPGDFVRVEIGKGCCLILSQSEYANAVARGKRLRRRQQFRQRQQPKPPAPLPLFKGDKQ
jgi:hypothetical protein